MHKTEQLKEVVEEELCKLGKKAELTPAEMDYAYKAAKTLYYMTVTKAMNERDEEDEYSEMSGGRSNRSYDYSMYTAPHTYAMNSNRSYARHRYSRNDEREAMIEKLEDMMDDAVSKSEKETIQRCINKMQRD